MLMLAGRVSHEIAMDMAKVLFKLGKKQNAGALLQNIGKNNHESAEILHQVQAVFESEQLADEGQALIQETQQDVVVVNNHGVVLAKKGEFEEGAQLLRTAAQNLVNSEIIIMNLCGLLLALMNKEGKSNFLARKVEDLRNRARKLNQANRENYLYAGVIARIVNP